MYRLFFIIIIIAPFYIENLTKQTVNLKNSKEIL